MQIEDKNDIEESYFYEEGLSDDLALIAETVGLSREKKKLIANKRLKDHPEMQVTLIHEIDDVSNDKAREIVAQRIMDLETGYYEKTKDGYTIDNSKREKIEKDPVQIPIDALTFMQHT